MDALRKPQAANGSNFFASRPPPHVAPVRQGAGLVAVGPLGEPATKRQSCALWLTMWPMKQWTQRRGRNRYSISKSTSMLTLISIAPGANVPGT